MMAVGPMTDEDLTAVVSYLRSIPPVENAVAPHDVSVLGKVPFQGPMKAFVVPHTYPVPPFAPPGEVSVERGRYLAEGPAFCKGCHTDATVTDDGLVFDEQALSGNVGSPIPDESDMDFLFYAPNLTPDPETGHMAGWTEEQFIERLRAGRVYP